MSRRFLFLLALCCASPALLYALIGRAPNPAERKVLAKYAHAVNSVLSQFRSPDWQEKIDISGENPHVAPNDANIPLTVDEIFQRTYDLKPGTPRYKAAVGALEQKRAAEKDIGEKQLLKAQMEDHLHVQVQIRSNVPSINLNPPPSPALDLHVPGAAFAYKQRSNPYGYGVAYVLAFGNWKAAHWFASSAVYEFHFRHPGNSPFIENVEVRLYGSEERIRELLRKVKWAEINTGLTP